MERSRPCRPEHEPVTDLCAWAYLLLVLGHSWSPCPDGLFPLPGPPWQQTHTLLAPQPGTKSTDPASGPFWTDPQPHHLQPALASSVPPRLPAPAGSNLRDTHGPQDCRDLPRHHPEHEPISTTMVPAGTPLFLPTDSHSRGSAPCGSPTCWPLAGAQCRGYN